VLQRLLNDGLLLDGVQLCLTAASWGRMNILAFLHEQRLLPAPHQLSEALQVAGAFGRLVVAQWLRQRGAEWPPVLNHEYTPWTGAVLEWARAEGCIAPTEIDNDDDVEEEED
jgi:hypothetical protein